MANIVVDGVPEKIKANMPPDLAAQFLPLFQEVFWLGAKWTEYRILYGSGKDTVDLLNRTAGYLFLIVQDTLWDDLLLHIARLTGPIKSMGKDNLTVRRLPDLIDDQALRLDLSRRIESCLHQAAYVSDHRSKRLAHHDLAMALNDGAKELTGVSGVMIGQTVEALQDIIRVVYGHYTDTHFIFDTNLQSHNSDALIYALMQLESSRQPS